MPFNKLFQLLRGRGQAPKPDAAQPPVAPAAIEPDGPARTARVDKLDLQAAIIHHLEWCVAFNDHLSHIHQADAPPVQRPAGADASALGQWLQRSAPLALGKHPAFDELLREHRQFHELAEEALKLATEDRMDLASTLLNTDFERSRARVVALLRDLQNS
jgi:hypothetical protein